MSNLSVIEEYFTRVADEPESTRSLYAEECVLHYGGSHSLSGDYLGIESVLAMFRRSPEVFGRPLVLRPFDLMASERHVVALLNATFASGTPDEQSWLRAVVFRLVDGEIAEQWLFDYDQALVASLQR